MRPLATLLAALLLPLAACTTDDTPTASTPRPEASPPAEATATSPLTPATPTPRPAPTITPLEEIYDPQVFDSPAIYSQCCARMWFPTRIAPPSLAAAEAEGELYLDGYRSTEAFPDVFGGAPGTSELSCVNATDVNERGRVQSGDFLLDVSSWDDPDFELVLFPRLIYDNGLFLRATKIDDGPEPATHFHQLDATPGRDPESGSRRFQATLILPEAGAWVVVATAGSQWGCFIVEAPQPPPAHAAVPDVATAEQIGTAYPSEPTPEYLSPGFLAERGPDVRHPSAPWNMRGGPDRACLDITGAHDARSGEWIIRPAWGPFTEGGPRSPGTKLIAIPRSQPGSRAQADAWFGTPRQELRMTATLVEAPQHTYVYERDEWNARVGSEESGTTEFTHVLGAVMPRDEGSWLVVVTDGIHGTQWGCFLAPEGLPVAFP